MLNIWDHLTPEARRALLAAQIEAQREGRRRVSPAHLLLAALDSSAAAPEPKDAEPTGATAPAETVSAETTTDTAAARALLFLDVEPQLLRLAVHTRLRAIPPPPRGAAEPKPSRAAQRSLDYAVQEAGRLNAHHIGTEHLLLGVARTRLESMPWDTGFLWALRRLRVISDARWRALRRDTRTTHLVVPEILDEFGLDLPALRVAAAGQDPRGTTPHWTREVQRAIDAASKEARAAGAGRVGAEHLWLGLLADSATAATDLLHECEVAAACLASHLRAALRADSETAGTKTRYTAEARRCFAGAERVAREARCRYIGSDHLLIALAGAAPIARPSARERAGQLLAAEPASRANAAIDRALHEMGLPPGYLQSALAKPGQLVHLKAQLRTVGDATARVHAIVARELQLPPQKIHADTPLPAATIHIVQACAREFGITFAPSDFKRIRTVGELANIVCSKRRPEQSESDDTDLLAFTNIMALLAPAGIWAVIFVVFTVTDGDLRQLEALSPWPCLILLPYAAATLSARYSAESRQRYRVLSRLYLVGWAALMAVLLLAPNIM